jgi:phosphoribosylaminoimidazolecarboxamide formyltransferase/IMP cyclohydrolase
MIERALLSVYDKAELDVFVRGLTELGVELVASGGTAGYIEEHELGVTLVEELTGVGEMLGGRVKTLHPHIHAAILARPDEREDLETLEEHGIRPFQLVCVNLYPFTQIAWRRGVDEAEAVELIDVGGPAMLRAAAKNFAYVAPVSRPDQYAHVLEELHEQGELSLETRRRLAAEAFATTSAYESAIANWFTDRDAFPRKVTVSFEKVLDLAYGENPHQRAALYAEDGARRHVLSRVEQLQGKPLSFNNLYDLSSARAVVEEFAVPACAIVKHANPCGVALGQTLEEAFANAYAADPVSAYGGVVVCNRPVSRELGEQLAEQFLELVFAPGYDPTGLTALARKPAMRVLLDAERRHASPGERDYRRVLGGILVQDRDVDLEDRESMEVVCGEPTEEDWGQLLFAWRVCKHGLSNAIVLAQRLQTVGIGIGQMSRVDAVRIALGKAAEHGHEVAGTALASDAFFPFDDGPRLALEAGVRAIIQPGGSKRDDDVIAAVREAGAIMVFTGRRHFRH